MQLTKTVSMGIFVIRINWLIAACVLITALTFARLGLWQLDRAAQQVDAQAELEAELAVSAGPVEDIPLGHLHPANPEMRNRHVLLKGNYINDRTILIAAEFFQGQIGYGVVTPLRLESNNELVLVHRGWTTGILPAGVSPDLKPVEGLVSVTAQVYVPTGDERIIASEIDPSSWPINVRSLEIDVISQILDEAIFPFEVRLTEDQAGTLVRHWPAVNVNVNQNLSYALQWFSFALLVLFFSVLGSSNLWAIIKGDE